MSGICLSNKKLAIVALAALMLVSCAPYHAQKGVTKFHQQGEASWYGPGFQGKKTANGERFNTGAMTAAHRTLPFGTTVRVTNLENGKSALVRINDRGPFAHGRIIDLSKAAAKEIGLLGTGTASVEIRAVAPGREDEEAPIIAAAEETSKVSKKSKRLLLASKGPVKVNGVAHLISVETGENPTDPSVSDNTGESDEDSSIEHAEVAPDSLESEEISTDTPTAPVVKKAAPTPKTAKLAKAEKKAKQPIKTEATVEEETPATNTSIDDQPF